MSSAADGKKKSGWSPRAALGAILLAMVSGLAVPIYDRFIREHESITAEQLAEWRGGQLTFKVQLVNRTDHEVQVVSVLLETIVNGRRKSVPFDWPQHLNQDGRLVIKPRLAVDIPYGPFDTVQIRRHLPIWRDQEARFRIKTAGGSVLLLLPLIASWRDIEHQVLFGVADAFESAKR